MHRGAVRVAVDQAVHPFASQGGADFPGVHVHDFRRCIPCSDTAGQSKQAGQTAPEPARPSQHSALPVRISHARSKSLVGHIVGAQHVAVQQHHALPTEFETQRLFQPEHAGPATIVVSQKKITVAGDEGNFDAGLGRCRETLGDFTFEIANRVVADPGLEEVAKYDQSSGPAGRAVEKFEELPGDVRASGLQVQVGNDQRVGRRGDVDPPRRDLSRCCGPEFPRVR